MIKYHINNNLVQRVQNCKRFKDLSDEEHIRLYDEIKNATLQQIDEDLTLYSGDKLSNDVNSLLLWVLEITDNYPTDTQVIKSPGSMMDIDLDFSKENRGKVYEYLAEKYGGDKVSYVATFGTMAAKGAIRNAARALGFPIDLQNKVAKFIPESPGITIEESIDSNKDFAKLIKTSEEVSQIIDIAKKLEGLPNSLGVHASACVIADENITNTMPVMISGRKDASVIMTQFEYKDVESNALLKFDILGLETLDVISKTVEFIKKYKGIDIDVNSIDINDPGIYKLLEHGHVTNIFQFDGACAAFLPKIRPENISEISAMTSLVRPGPLSLGLNERYAEGKFENRKFDYGLKDKKLLAKVWELCYASYGLLVFQEQLISCFKHIGGFDDVSAEEARRATGKKDLKLLESLKERFVNGGLTNGYTKDGLESLFHQFEGFASYSFNGGHAYAYSMITCQTAWLSYYYPLEFMVASLTISSDNTEKVRSYIKAVKSRGYSISAPDINKSEVDFTITDEAIVFGLSGIKGVGRAVSNKILRRRPKKGYKSLGHFVIRNLDILNKKILENYAKAGAFKGFGINKTSAIISVQDILHFMDVHKSISDYNTIFDIAKVDLEEYFNTCLITEIEKEDPLDYEIETLGLYITKHPLEDFIVNNDNSIPIKDLYNDRYNDQRVTAVGAICNIAVKKTKAKTNMASFDLTCPDNSINCLCFPKVYSQVQDALKEGKLVGLTGVLRDEDGLKTLLVNDVNEPDLYLCKMVAKKDSWVPPKKIDVKDLFKLMEPSDFVEFSVVVNPQLEFILRRD